MMVKRLGLGGLMFVIVFAVLAPATNALATTGCGEFSVLLEGSSTSTCQNITGSQGGSVSTFFDHTTVTVTFPPNPAAGNFTYNVTALDLLICGGQQCRGAAADLGNLPAHYDERTAIVVQLKYDPSISPRPGRTLPVYEQNSRGTRRLASCLLTLGNTPCVSSQRWDDSGSLTITTRFDSDDPRIGAGP